MAKQVSEKAKAKNNSAAGEGHKNKSTAVKMEAKKSTATKKK